MEATAKPNGHAAKKQTKERTAKKKATNGHARLSNRVGVATGAAQFLEAVDHRSRAARRYRDLCADLAEHLGGAAHISAVREHIMRRACALIVWAEAEESKLVEVQEGPPFDPVVYSTAVNSLHRLLQSIGLNPHLKVFAPDLRKYVSAVIDAGETVDIVPDQPVPDAEPVKRDARGRVLRGTPEQAEAARRMRETAAKKKAEREAAELRMVREAVESAKAEHAARQAGGEP
ncbi:hypothetical protein [Rhizobium sp. RAF56]|uniref:hypothetical protein n=1 Tax=Rhizobium sp. RAF56 TaxID=3233062 RepID=UPI003F951E11